MFEIALNNLLAFVSFFAVAIAILTVFLTVYALITPYNELALLRQGNAAAAVSLSGALLGIAMPVATAVAVSHKLLSMLGWGLLACAVQLCVFLAARVILPQIATDIPQGRLASGIFLASLSIGVGIINAACIV
jgi:putative membrane protein